MRGRRTLVVAAAVALGLLAFGTRLAASAAAPPDLVITGVSLTTPAATPQNGFEVAVRVRNQGGSPAVFDDPVVKVIGAGAEVFQILPAAATGTSLVAGATAVFRAIPSGLGARVGSTRFGFRVDPNDDVAEADESNNGASLVVDVVAPEPTTGPAADLVVSGCAFVPPNPRAQDATRMQFEYANTGAAAAAIQVGAAIWEATFTPALGGATKLGGNAAVADTLRAGDDRIGEARIAHGSKAPGVYKAVLRLDPDDRVAESDEANNSATCTLVVTN